MKRRVTYLLFLFVLWVNFISICTVYADQTNWTEEKIGKFAVKAEKAATRKKWSSVIKYGERMLAGSISLYGFEAPRTIIRLKTLNRYYDHAGRLDDVPLRIKNAYLLSKQYFRPTHDTAQVSRLLYYKLLITQKKYTDAIPLVYENMALLSESEDDAFKRLHYMEQLHGLYGATGQVAHQEKILSEKLALNKQLMGPMIKDNIEIIMNLAETYCLQNKIEAFKQLMQTYDLSFVC